jgi:cobalamin 5'-phosphate synthase/cobalamin synthase
MIVIVGVLITGALHLDGLADMADGFGGGRSRDEVLRIMRDHAIGAYGSIALTLVLALKIVSILAMIDRGVAYRLLVIAPAVARGSVVVLGFILPYARATEGGLGGISHHVRIVEVLVSTLLAVGVALWLGVWRGSTILAVTAIASAWNARLCRKKIQGITGDTLGANVEVCEALVLAVGAILSS